MHHQHGKLTDVKTNPLSKMTLTCVTYASLQCGSSVSFCHKAVSQLTLALVSSWRNSGNPSGNTSYFTDLHLAC